MKMRNPSFFMSKDKNSMLIGLFVMALLAFNYPILSIFGEGVTVWGFPIFYVYIFSSWLILLVLIYIWVEKEDSKKR